MNKTITIVMVCVAAMYAAYNSQATPSTASGSCQKTMVSGEKDGLYTDCWDNVQKKEEGQYKNGKKEGVWMSWYENGQKKVEADYNKGTEVYWNSDGVLEKKELRKNGKLQSTIYYKPDGSVDRTEKK